MENATRAFMIAGGVLLAILILGLIVYAYTSFSSMGIQEEERTRAEQLAEFNKPYESYEGKTLRAQELISVVNRAINDNEKNGINIAVKVKIVKTLEAGGRYLDGFEQAREYNFTGADKQKFLEMCEDKTKGGKKENFTGKRFFKCTEIKYNKGRINELCFTEV